VEQRPLGRFDTVIDLSVWHEKDVCAFVAPWTNSGSNELFMLRREKVCVCVVIG